jgi:hypothetical protein
MSDVPLKEPIETVQARSVMLARASGKTRPVKNLEQIPHAG